MGSLKSVVLGIGLGAVIAYFLDPIAGRRRRKMSVDRAAALIRQGWRRGERARRAVAADAYGVMKKLAHRKETPKGFDDVTLAHKVESEVFRDPDIPKGQINVNVHEGVVQLRGVVPTPDVLSDLLKKTRRVQGVREVENLLHLPKTRAPMHE